MEVDLARLPAFRIRPAQAADVDAIIAIAHACFGLSAWGAAHFAPHPARTLHVAENGVPACVGYSVIECAAGEAELQALAVLEAHRRHGIGAALLQAARATAGEHGAREIFLEVRESNLTAQAFYGRFGFARCGFRPAYYRAPEEAAVLMRCALP